MRKLAAAERTQVLSKGTGIPDTQLGSTSTGNCFLGQSEKGVQGEIIVAQAVDRRKNRTLAAGPHRKRPLLCLSEPWSTFS